MGRKQSQVPAWVKERIARQSAAREADVERQRQQRVYGRRDEPAPLEMPSESVKAVPSAVETNRHRH
ncbi:hypothetical protein [Streptomyces sp. NPDC001275]